MVEWVRSNAKVLLLVTVLVLLIVIMAQLAISGRLLEDTRDAELGLETYNSNDSPTSYQYFVVESVAPSGTRITWKDIKVLTREPCTEVHLNTSKDPPKYDCPKAVKAVEGLDYKVDDKDWNGRVSKGDSLRISLRPSEAWNKELIIKWKGTGDVLYQDRLTSP